MLYIGLQSIENWMTALTPSNQHSSDQKITRRVSPVIMRFPTSNKYWAGFWWILRSVTTISTSTGKLCEWLPLTHAAIPRANFSSFSKVIFSWNKLKSLQALALGSRVGTLHNTVQWASINQTAAAPFYRQPLTGGRGKRGECVCLCRLTSPAFTFYLSFFHCLIVSAG